MDNAIKKSEESLDTEKKDRKPFSVSDLNDITVAVSLNGVDTKANFSSLLEAYEKMRVWHRQIMKGKEDLPRVSYAMQLGFKKDDPYAEKGLPSIKGLEWKDTVIKDDYIVTQKELDLSNLIEWIASQIRTKYILKPFSSTTNYLEVHVSWNVWNGYFHIIRRRNGILINHSHDIMDTSWNTRAILMQKLLGHEWTFAYRNRQGEAHYYYGGIQPIHEELMRIATAAYQVSNSRNLMTQSDALEALFQLYQKYPDMKVSLLTNHYLVEDIIQLSSPKYNEDIRNSALPLLRLIPPEESLPSMETIYDKLLSQLEQWRRSIDTNKIVVDRMKESTDSLSKEHRDD